MRASARITVSAARALSRPSSSSACPDLQPGSRRYRAGNSWARVRSRGWLAQPQITALRGAVETMSGAKRIRDRARRRQRERERFINVPMIRIAGSAMTIASIRNLAPLKPARGKWIAGNRGANIGPWCARTRSDARLDLEFTADRPLPMRQVRADRPGQARNSRNRSAHIGMLRSRPLTRSKPEFSEVKDGIHDDPFGWFFRGVRIVCARR